MGVIISIPIMIILVVMLFGSAVDILKGSTQVGAGIVLPGPTSTPIVVPALMKTIAEIVAVSRLRVKIRLHAPPIVRL